MFSRFPRATENGWERELEMYYSAIGILAFMVLLIENMDVLLNRNGAFDKPSWRVCRRLLCAVFVYYITDMLWGWIEHRKGVFSILNRAEDVRDQAPARTLLRVVVGVEIIQLVVVVELEFLTA